MTFNRSIRTRVTLPMIFFIFHAVPSLQAAPALATAKAATQGVRLTGFTRARTVLDLATEATGKVEMVFSEMGQTIGKKGKFACLDQTFINLDIEGNKAEVAKTQIDIDYFTKQVARYRKLLSQNSSSQQQLDDLQRSLGSAEQQLRTLKTRNRELLERKKRFCMSAPKDWIIIERYIEPGEWVQSGDPVAKVGNFSRLLIPFALSMTEYKALRNNADQLNVELPDLGMTLPAHLERVSPAFDEKSRKIMLDLEIAGDLKQLRGGIRADLLLHLPNAGQSVILPKTAVDERYEQHWVERPTGERVSVVYLGSAKSDDANKPMVRISHPDIQVGQQFILQNQ